MFGKNQKNRKLNTIKKAKASVITIGDSVLIKSLAFSGPHKLADKFEEAIYKVIGQPNADIPVFDVQDPEGKVKRLYRTHLFY